MSISTFLSFTVFVSTIFIFIREDERIIQFSIHTIPQVWQSMLYSITNRFDITIADGYDLFKRPPPFWKMLKKIERSVHLQHLPSESDSHRVAH